MVAAHRYIWICWTQHRKDMALPPLRIKWPGCRCCDPFSDEAADDLAVLRSLSALPGRRWGPTHGLWWFHVNHCDFIATHGLPSIAWSNPLNSFATINRPSWPHYSLALLLLTTSVRIIPNHSYYLIWIILDSAIFPIIYPWLIRYQLSIMLTIN